MGFFSDFKQGLYQGLTGNRGGSVDEAALKSQRDANAFTEALNYRGSAEQMAQELAGNGYTADPNWAPIDPNSQNHYIDLYQKLALLGHSSPEFAAKQQEIAYKQPELSPWITNDQKDYQYGVQNPDFAQYELRKQRAAAPSFSMKIPGQESPVMPKDTWDLFTYEDGSPLIRPPTQAEVAAGRTVDGRGLQMKSNVDATQAKAGMAAITMSQYELENSMKKYGYNPEESNPDNRLSYAATWGLDKLASLDPGAANYFGKRGQEAAERQSAFRYWSELPLRILTGAVINDDEKEGIRMQYLPVQGESAEQAKKKEARRVIFQNAMLEQSRGNNPAGIMLIGNKITDLGKMQIPEIGQVNVKMTPDGNMLITAADGDSKIVKPEQLSKLLLPSTPTSIRKR